MKKLLTKILSFSCAATLAFPLAACGDGRTETVNVYMPDGAPAVALSALMDSGYAGTKFEVVQPAVIGGLVANGTADMAIMPVNAAATLYNRNIDIVMLSVNTHGNLYIIGKGGETDVEGLVGHSLGVIGAGNVPDLTVRMLFDELDIEYASASTPGDKIDGKVALTYADDATGILPLLKSGKLDYALVGEPAATNSGVGIVMDMQEQWELAFGDGYPQACLVAKGSLIDNNRKYVDGFLDALVKSDGWAAANPEKALAAVNAHLADGVQGSLTALTAEIVANCNIRTVPAEQMRESCETFFTKLTAVQTGLGTAALAKVPDLDFYYQP